MINWCEHILRTEENGHPNEGLRLITSRMSTQDLIYSRQDGNMNRIKRVKTEGNILEVRGGKYLDRYIKDNVTCLKYFSIYSIVIKRH